MGRRFPAFLLAVILGPLSTGLFAGRVLAAQFTCGDATAPAGVSASDALAALRTAVLLSDCSVCACDANDSGTVTASDALLILKASVGQNVNLACPFCCPICECTPQKLKLTLADVENCEDCIARIPTSNFFIDSITIEFDRKFDDSYELEAVAECVWEAVLPDALVKKTYWGSGVSDCSGSPSTSSEGGDVLVRVTRTETGWQTRVGTYVSDLGWGDIVTADIESASCEVDGSAKNQNEICHLAEKDNSNDYDTHAIDGAATIEFVDEKPVCP